MAKVTAVCMDTITKKSNHMMTPCAVSVCMTPAAPSPLPLPYPVTANVSEGIVDPPMRTKFDGAIICTVGSCIKKCHGNEPGTLKEVVSLNTTGPCFLIMGAPVVFIELGMAGITGSPGFLNKAITVGASGSASGAGGASGGGGGAGGGSASSNDPSASQAPSRSAGSGSGGSATGASQTAASPTPSGPPSEETRRLAREPNVEGDAAGNAQREQARRQVAADHYDTNHREIGFDRSTDPPRAHLRPPTTRERESALNDIDYSRPVSTTEARPQDGLPASMDAYAPPGNSANLPTDYPMTHQPADQSSVDRLNAP